MAGFTLERLFPDVGFIAVHILEERMALGPAQQALNLARQRQRLWQRPLRKQARVHHQEFVFKVNELLIAQPFEQLFAIWRVKNRLKRVAFTELRQSLCDREKMQIVIAEDDSGARTQTTDKAQARKRIRPAVNEIADKP